MIADVICYWKNDVIQGVRRCNVVLCLKDVTNTCKRLRRGLSIVKDWREFFGAKAESLKKLKTSSLLCNRIEIEQLQCVICCILGNLGRIISEL